MITALLSTFLASYFSTFLIVRFSHLHTHVSGDNLLEKPQKFHTKIVPRIGGLSIIIGLFVPPFLNHQLATEDNYVFLKILTCSILAFLIGFAEDIFKNIKPSVRLMGIVISAAIAVHLLDLKITRLDIYGIDSLMKISLISAVITIFAISGLANSYNIIDGFNGLASMVGIITLLCIAYVGYAVGDKAISTACLVLLVSILPVFFWNYPSGLVFLGDGGAYLIGFWIAIVSILLVDRNPQVSPFFALLANAYPVLETIFTMYRRGKRNKKMAQPDATHFHSLIFRRILKGRTKSNNSVYENSRTSPYLWMLTCIGVIPAALCFQSTPILIACAAIFFLSYLIIYRKIIEFKTPKWLKLD